MKKDPPSKAKLNGKKVRDALKPSYYILMFAYLVVPVFMPAFGALDTNGPKFLSIAILNLLALLLLFTDTDFKKRMGMQSGFFRNTIGLAYSAFLIISLLSFVQAINVVESVMTFAKLFSVFTTVFVLYIIFSSNRKYLLHAAAGLAILLIFDSLSVFYHILGFLNHQVASIYDIKSIYSNKNILAAALFIKIPASIWLMLYSDGWKKKLGYTAFLSGVIAVLFMSARAFYLGLALLIIALVLFFVLRHFLIKRHLSAKRVLIYAGAVVIALAAFSLVQKFLYPKNQTDFPEFSQSIWQRLSTIKAGDSSTNSRLGNWSRSLGLIHEHPFLGVGTGNWKIAVLKQEGPTTDLFIVSYKNHNDFMEVTAESGIPGGLIYLSIFVLILLNFARAALSRKGDEDKVKYLFLPAFGILAYSVDAFFNFPNDRPEIQVLFATYVAMAIAFSGDSFPSRIIPETKPPFPPKKSHDFKEKMAFSLAFLLLGTTTLILAWNAKSLHFQKIAFEDMNDDQLTYSSSFFTRGFPPIPNLGCLGAPVSTYTARYLINENRSQEAIKLLMKDKSSPYDGRREYFLSMAYDQLRMPDSVIYWGLKVHELKPRFAQMVFALNVRLSDAGRHQEAIQIMEEYLSVVKTNAGAWLAASDQYLKTGDERKALILLDSAAKYLPADKQIIDKRESLSDTGNIKPYESLYNQANQAMQLKQYPEALNLLNDFISKKPGFTKAYQMRASCLYYAGEYAKSILDVETALKKGDVNEAFLLNLRGISYIGLGKNEEACLDFKMSMEKGNADGATNFRTFCQQTPTK